MTLQLTESPNQWPRFFFTKVVAKYHVLIGDEKEFLTEGDRFGNV